MLGFRLQHLLGDVGHVGGAKIACAHRRKHILGGLIVHFAGQVVEIHFVQRQAFEFVFQDRPAIDNVAVAVLLLEPMGDLGPGTGGLDIPQARVKPVTAGRLVIGREDGYLITGLQRVGQRHDAAINLGPATGMADFGVHAIGEIHRCRTLWQVYHMAFRREHVDPVGGNIGLEVIRQPGQVAELFLPFQHLP